MPEKRKPKGDHLREILTKERCVECWEDFRLLYFENPEEARDYLIYRLDLSSEFQKQFYCTPAGLLFRGESIVSWDERSYNFHFTDRFLTRLFAHHTNMKVRDQVRVY